MERELLRLEIESVSPRLGELEELIPAQEDLALGKLGGDGVSYLLDPLNILLEKA